VISAEEAGDMNFIAVKVVKHKTPGDRTLGAGRLLVGRRTPPF